jgi:hypothetical protein
MLSEGAVMRILSVLASGALLTLSACVYGPPPPGYAPYGSVPQQVASSPIGNCHDVSQTIIIDGQQQQAASMVCQQQDGSWAPVSPQQQAADDQSQTQAGSTYPYYYGYPAAYGYDAAYPWYDGYDPAFVGGFGFGGGLFFDRFHHFHHFGGGHFAGGHFAGGGGHFGGGGGGGGHFGGGGGGGHH